MLTSNLLKDEPELLDLVDKFMLRLPVMRDSIILAHKNNNEKELSGLIHQLKGVGGGYGYPMLTELCSKIEIQIEIQNQENIKALIKELSTITEAVLAGNDENHKIAEQSMS